MTILLLSYKLKRLRYKKQFIQGQNLKALNMDFNAVLLELQAYSLCTVPFFLLG